MHTFCSYKCLVWPLEALRGPSPKSPNGPMGPWPDKPGQGPGILVGAPPGRGPGTQLEILNLGLPILIVIAHRWVLNFLYQ